MAVSIRQQIAKLQATIDAAKAKIEELLPQAENEIDTASIAAGFVVVTAYGRGEKARDVEAKVLGVKREAGKAALFKVLIGEGFDAEQGIVFESAIKSIVSKPEPAADPLASDTGVTYVNGEPVVAGSEQ